MTGLAVVGGHSLPEGLAGEAARRIQVTVAGGEGRRVAVDLIEGDGVIVLPRHGLDEFHPAHLVDHVAHARALAELGCDRVLGLASVGSLRVDLPVGSVVVPDDVFAPWVNPSLFDDGRGHSVPGFDAGWRSTVLSTWRTVSTTPVVDGGVYVQTRGPRFETPAEIRWYATLGDVVGMTIAAEYVLFAEAGLRYGVVSLVDNLANGVAGVQLSEADFGAGVAANRATHRADLSRLVPALVSSGGSRA